MLQEQGQPARRELLLLSRYFLVFFESDESFQQSTASTPTPTPQALHVETTERESMWSRKRMVSSDIQMSFISNSGLDAHTDIKSHSHGATEPGAV